MNLLNDICNPKWITKNVIYCYTNKTNNKKYVGQTIQTLKSRHSNHMYDSFNEKRIKNYNNPFHNAIRKYGIENFSLEILHIADKYSLDLLEIHYIEKWDLTNKNYGYNCKNGGSNGWSMENKTEEEIESWKDKIRKNNKGENNPFYGKKHTEKSKRKMSEKQKKLTKGEKNGMYGKHHTEETKQVYKEKFSKKVIQYDEEMNIVKIWNSIRDIERELNFKRQAIINCLKGRTKTSYGFIWKYYE